MLPLIDPREGPTVFFRELIEGEIIVDSDLVLLTINVEFDDVAARHIDFLSNQGFEQSVIFFRYGTE